MDKQEDTVNNDTFYQGPSISITRNGKELKLYLTSFEDTPPLWFIKDFEVIEEKSPQILKPEG